MLGDKDVFAMVATEDIAKAKELYGGTLGLEQLGDDEGGAMYKSGSGRIMVYESEYAGTNRATTATWEVDDMAGVVGQLKGKGVQFEHYDMPDVKHEGEIHVWGEMKAAWFKDPDGNILGLSSMPK